MKWNTKAILGSIAALVMLQSAAGSARAGAAEDAPSLTPVCALLGIPLFKGVSNIRKPRKEARNVMNWITDTVGLSANFDLRTADFERGSIAFAAIQDSRRYIIYDSKERFVDTKGRISWTDIAVMAHEVGHHLAGHTTVSSTSDWEQELEADRFAGFVLGRLGANLSQATSWTAILSEKGSKTHPPRANRTRAAQAGWHRAEQLKTREAPLCVPDWIDEPFNIGEQSCRLAKRCDQRRAKIQVACQNPEDGWFWVPQGSATSH